MSIPELETVTANSKNFITALVNLNAKFHEKYAALNFQNVLPAAQASKAALGLAKVIISQLDDAHFTGLVPTAFEIKESAEYMALISAAAKLQRKLPSS